jgi:hypothetical protein
LTSLILMLSTAATGASPVEFGRRELLAAIEARGLKPERFKVITEHSMVLPADGYSIQGYLIRGGNLRGIMFGLLEAASQIRKSGALRPAKGAPQVPVRGVRWTHPLPADPGALFASLARARFNRFVAAGAEVSLEELRRAADAAAAHGLDFGAVAGAGQSPQELMQAIPQLKFIEARASGGNLAAVAAAGRMVTLDLDGETLTGEELSAALETRIPLQIAVSPSRFGDFLRKPAVAGRERAWGVVWRLRTPPAAGPKFVRAVVPMLTASRSQGFDIEAPASPAPLFYEIWGRLAYNASEQATSFAATPNLLEALEAASVLSEPGPLSPLAELLDRPMDHRGQASPNEAARLRVRGESSAKSRPLERVEAFDKAALAIGRAGPALGGLKLLENHARAAGRRLAAADHLAWARIAGDRDSIAAARREAAAALALVPNDPVLQADLAYLDSPIELAEPPGQMPGRYPGTVTRPAMDHTPPRQAIAGQPLTLTLRISAAANLKTVRLHWRPFNANAAWQAMEASPARAVFTLPAGAIEPSHDIEYYFEVLHTMGSGWFVPEEVAGAIPGRYWVETVVAVDRAGGAW